MGFILSFQGMSSGSFAKKIIFWKRQQPFPRQIHDIEILAEIAQVHGDVLVDIDIVTCSRLIRWSPIRIGEPGALRRVPLDGGKPVLGLDLGEARGQQPGGGQEDRVAL